LEHQFLRKDVRKLIQVGKCFAVTVPREYVEAHKLKLGDLLEISFNCDLHIEPVNEAEILSKLGLRPKRKKDRQQADRLERELSKFLIGSNCGEIKARYAGGS